MNISVTENAAELVAVWAPIFISACAFAITVWQFFALRAHNRLSVTPYLTTFVDRLYDDKGRFTYVARLRNQGLGPAIIDGFEVLVSGVAHSPSQPDELISLIASRIPAPVIDSETYCSVVRPGYTLGKGDTVTLAHIRLQTYLQHTREQIEQPLESLHVRIRYRSIYKTRYEYDSRRHQMSGAAD